MSAIEPQLRSLGVPGRLAGTPEKVGNYPLFARFTFQHHLKINAGLS